MEIRVMREADLPRVRAIEEANQVVPWGMETFTQCFKAGYSGWVMENEGKIMGFVLVSLLVEECHILNLCVDMKARGQGFGQALMLFALQEAKTRGMAIAYLEVRRSNSRAIRLYKHLGFTQIAERKDYYPVPTGREDALVFAKDLGIS